MRNRLSPGFTMYVTTWLQGTMPPVFVPVRVATGVAVAAAAGGSVGGGGGGGLVAVGAGGGSGGVSVAAAGGGGSGELVGPMSAAVACAAVAVRSGVGMPTLAGCEHATSVSKHPISRQVKVSR